MRRVRADWRAVVLVCGKCSRKLDGGFGPKRRTPLAKALRKWIGKGKGRKTGAGIVEVPCLKICPKAAVTVVNGTEPGRWLIVDAGTPVDEVAGRLGLTARRSRHAELVSASTPLRTDALAAQVDPETSSG